MQLSNTHVMSLNELNAISPIDGRYRNKTEKLGNNSIQVALKGVDKNPYALGSTVVFYFDEQEVRRELIPSRGFQSSMDYRLHQGLGKVAQLDSIRVIWPDQKTQLLTDVKANQLLQLEYNADLASYVIPAPEKPQTLLAQVDQKLISHKENNYSDFD